MNFSERTCLWYIALRSRGGVSLAQQQMFIVALVIILLANAGRNLGLDGLLLSGKSKGAR